MIPESLIDNLHKSILHRINNSQTELFAPVHGLTIACSDTGIIQMGNTAVNINTFTDQLSPCTDETLRMYRQAFLTSPASYSKINISLTNHCTLHCPHCFIEHKETPVKSKFNKTVIKKISAYEPSEISLTGGEIFLTENLEDIINEIETNIKKRILIRLLANSSWIYNQNKINEFLNYLKKIKSVVQFRFTLFHHKPEIHDSICGSAGHLDAVSKVIKLLKEQNINFSVNFPIMSFSFISRNETIGYLEDLTEGNYTVSSIVYPSINGHRAARKFSLSKEQFSMLLNDRSFRSLASAYCDPSEQCQYHCRFPLFDSEGNLFHCNLPESYIVKDLYSGISLQENKMCINCSAGKWCKKCPSSVPEFQDIYCPLSRIAAEKIKLDYESALKAGFQSLIS